MAKKSERAGDRLVAVEGALSSTEQFIEQNQKIITIVVGIIVVIVLGYFGYKKFYLAPMNKEAKSEMFMAELYFQKDSLNKALLGDGNYPGFIDIADQYGSTKAGNLANYYAGIIYLKQGDFETAIDYLQDFESEDQVIGPMALGAMGDAYIELGEPEKAVNYYLKAANTHINEFVTPIFLMKAGWAYEENGNYDKALRIYKRIKKDFNRSNEARDIERYIERAEAMAS
ncbi:MAG: tetratricopeptide repeat protein [Bacteroidales bacterium]|nr:tetratricopeptide repeat protein [Bacteroidales bacterium]MCF8396964.1 tetratricopeptide repeat protein [Bacteroidales bacterium]